MIFINECKEFFRDKINLIFPIAFPLILILLLGNMLSNLNYADPEVGFIKAEYIIATEQQMEQEMVLSFLASLNDTNSILMAESISETSSKEKIALGELDALVIFGGDLIEIYEGDEEIKNRTFSAVMNGFVQNKKAVMSIMKGMQEGDLKDNTLAISTETIRKSYTTKKDFDKNRSMLDYYGVSMIILIVFVGGIGGFSSFGNERTNKTINRLIASPMNRSSIFIQKVMGLMLGYFIEIAVIMIVGATLFDVHYANNLIDNILLFSLFLVTMVSLGCVGVSLGLVMKGNPLLIFGPVLWLMMFFGGTFSKDVYIEGLTPKLPVYQLQQAAFGLTIFGHKEKVMAILLVEILVTFVFIFIGVARFNKMQEQK